MDIKKILGEKRRRTRTVYILLDDSLATERDQLIIEAGIAERQDAWQNRKPEAPALQERIRDLDVKIAESRVPFVFGAMPRTRWVELDEEFTGDDGELDVEGFGPHLLAESSVDPVMTLEDVAEMWDTWSAAETEQLYIAAYRVNREVRGIPFIDAGTGATPSSGSNSTTSVDEE